MGGRGLAEVPSGWETCILGCQVLRAQEVALLGHQSCNFTYILAAPFPQRGPLCLGAEGCQIGMGGGQAESSGRVFLKMNNTAFRGNKLKLEDWKGKDEAMGLL